LRRAQEARGQWRNVSPEMRRAARDLSKEVEKAQRNEAGLRTFKVDVKFNRDAPNSIPDVAVTPWVDK